MPTPLNRKPAVAAWIVRERKRLNMKPRDVVTRLAAQGLTVSEATVKVWESNADRRPAPENLEGLERIFESKAPANGTPSADQSDLAAAIRGQTESITALVQELRLARLQQVEISEVALRAIGVLGASQGPPGKPAGGEHGAPVGTPR